MNEIMKDQSESSFRNYDDVPDRVRMFYTDQHRLLTFEKASTLNRKFTVSEKRAYSIDELMAITDSIFDPSDPDTNLSQTEHAYQTARGALKKGLPDEMVVIGLIHDLGKAVVRLLNIDMTYLVGDTFPLGAPFEQESITFGDSLSLNPDINDPRYNSGSGIYEEGCGFSNMLFTGHDEFIYLSLCESEHLLPDWAMYAVRFHSFYPWHTQRAYAKYADDYDRDTLKYVLMMNGIDLYTKHAEAVEESDKRAVDNIIARFLPNGLVFPVGLKAAHLDYDPEIQELPLGDSTPNKLGKGSLQEELL